MTRGLSTPNSIKTVKVRRPGVHAKTKQSKLKNSKNYIKKPVGQGK